MGTLWKSRWRLSVVLGIIAVIVATSIQFAISLASNQLSKESFVNENAQLTNKHGEVVQTVGAHFDYNDPDRNEIRQLDAGSLGAIKFMTFSMGSDMEVFKINGVRIVNADVPEERSVTFLSPYGTITASKDRIALNHVNGRRLKPDAAIVSSLLGENVTLGALKNLVTDKPAPITTKLAQMENGDKMKNLVTDKKQN